MKIQEKPIYVGVNEIEMDEPFVVYDVCAKGAQMFALVGSPRGTMSKRSFLVVRTGEEFRDGVYIGSIFMYETVHYHCFEILQGEENDQ